MNTESHKTFFGHPRGLQTLFFTELWERFSYYGMRALLILFMTDAVINGGMGLDERRAGAIYGLYTFGVYALALPGGWMADRLLGQRKAVLAGGIFIALGHFTLAIPFVPTFFLGLLLVVLGTGLLKPNVSAIVGGLYADEKIGARRDAGFSIFYMGINLGAFLGPTVCSLLGEKVGWHWGFSAAGIGMTFGLIQYVMGQKYLRGAGELRDPQAALDAWKGFFKGIGVVVLLVVLLLGLSSGGVLHITLTGFAKATGVIVVILSVLYFLYAGAVGCQNTEERKRVGLIAILFFGAAMFWAGFEQAGSSMNLFARDLTDRVVLGYEFPAGLLQNINPIFIILLAPVVGSIWVRLGDKNPSIGGKFAWGLVLLGAGFFVLAWGSSFAEAGKVSPMWLVVTYFMHTVGELCLSPIGLSSITKLAPKRLVGQMMGTWFMGGALGNLIAGLAAGYMEALSPQWLFGSVATISIVMGFVFVLIAGVMHRMGGGMK